MAFSGILWQALVRALADNVAALSQDQYGCRVIQKVPGENGGLGFRF